MDDDPNGGAPRRTRLPAAERRETILRAATEVFAEAGYRAAKVSDVAERIGVTEPVIFQNFGSKAALFAAVVDRAASQVRAWLDDFAADAGPTSALLAHVLAAGAAPGDGPPSQTATDPDAAHAAAGHGESAHAAAGHRERAHAAAGHGERAHAAAGQGHAAGAYGVLFADAAALTAEPALSEPARAAVRAVATHLADLVRRAQADGQADAGTDPEAAAWLVLSVLSARRMRAAAMPADLEPAVAALALRSLAPGPGHPPTPAAAVTS